MSEPTGPVTTPEATARPLTARSVIASTLLGMTPPRLPTLILVRSGELFGIPGGTTRVALSRMVAAGELAVDGNGYRLAGRLLERQTRQGVSRAASVRPWGGAWSMAVVVDRGRPAAERGALRDAMAIMRMGEVREGVWIRPDNLAATGAPEPEAVMGAQCLRFTAHAVDEPPAALAGRLWDLGGWASTAERLRDDIAGLIGGLEERDTDTLAPSFVKSAEVLRHFLADPLLPAVLVPDDWPGPALRADYERYDVAFKRVWRDWFGSQDV